MGKSGGKKKTKEQAKKAPARSKGQAHGFDAPNRDIIRPSSPEIKGKNRRLL